jgi:hypothetical protein
MWRKLKGVHIRTGKLPDPNSFWGTAKFYVQQIPEVPKAQPEGNQLVSLDLPWLAMHLQQVRPGAQQTRWSQLFFSFFTLSFHQIYLSTEIFVEEPAAPTSQARF